MGSRDQWFLERDIEEAEKLKLLIEAVSFQAPRDPGTKFTVKVGPLWVHIGYGLHRREYRNVEIEMKWGFEDFYSVFIMLVDGSDLDEWKPEAEGKWELPEGREFRFRLIKAEYERQLGKLRDQLEETKKSAV